jgi:hypothetical protein
MICKYCNTEFTPHPSVKNQFTCGNKECKRLRDNEYWSNHKEQKAVKDKRWRDNNKAKKAEIDRLYREKNKEYVFTKKKEYSQSHKAQINMYVKIYHKQRMIDDEQYAIRSRIRHRFGTALRKQGLRKIKSTKLYGINIQSIIDHLGPCPGNRNEYHIDHIRPLSSFDLRNETEIQEAFAPENHQWLRAEENLSKGCKYLEMNK